MNFDRDFSSTVSNEVPGIELNRSQGYRECVIGMRGATFNEYRHTDLVEDAKERCRTWPLSKRRFLIG